MHTHIHMHTHTHIHTHTHTGILLSHKKEWNNAIYNNMDGPGGCDAKWNKSEKDNTIFVHSFCF